MPIGPAGVDRTTGRRQNGFGARPTCDSRGRLRHGLDYDRLRGLSREPSLGIDVGYGHFGDYKGQENDRDL